MWSDPAQPSSSPLSELEALGGQKHPSCHEVRTVEAMETFLVQVTKLPQLTVQKDSRKLAQAAKMPSQKALIADEWNEHHQENDSPGLVDERFDAFALLFALVVEKDDEVSVRCFV